MAVHDSVVLQGSPPEILQGGGEDRGDWSTDAHFANSSGASCQFRVGGINPGRGRRRSNSIRLTFRRLRLPRRGVPFVYHVFHASMLSQS